MKDLSFFLPNSLCHSSLAMHACVYLKNTKGFLLILISNPPHPQLLPTKNVLFISFSHVISQLPFLWNYETFLRLIFFIHSNFFEILSSFDVIILLLKLPVNSPWYEFPWFRCFCTERHLGMLCFDDSGITTVNMFLFNTFCMKVSLSLV